MIILAWIFLGASLAVSVSFFVMAARHNKDKPRRLTYLLWGLAFLCLAAQEFSFLLFKTEKLNPSLAKELSASLWLGFLALLYGGTLYIFTKKIFIPLTYVFLTLALSAGVLFALLPSQALLIAFLAGFGIIIPLQMIIGILSWFLGLSLYRDQNALFAYWTAGVAWILSSVAVAWTVGLPLFTKDGTWLSGFYSLGAPDYISSLAEAMLLLAYLVLLWRRLIRKKECF